MFSNSFSFFTEIVSVKDHPLDFIDGYKIRRASGDEIHTFKSFLPVSNFKRYNPYEIEWKEKDEGGYSGYKIVDAQKWNYWGLSFEGQGDKLSQVKKIFNLLLNQVDVAFTIYSNSNGSAPRGFSQISVTCQQMVSGIALPRTSIIIIDSEWVEEFKTIWGLFNELGEDHRFIFQAIDSLESLKNIPDNLDLLVVGYFSIIECLITHKPRLAESLDSINHQLINKMNLLCKRFKQQVEMKDFFLDAKVDAIWKKLYRYRSCVAHGTKIDFGSELEVLKDQKTVVKFLRNIVKSLIVYVLSDPQFICDLRKC